VQRVKHPFCPFLFNCRIYIYVYIHIYINVCVCACMYVCVCLYTYRCVCYPKHTLCKASSIRSAHSPLTALYSFSSSLSACGGAWRAAGWSPCGANRANCIPEGGRAVDIRYLNLFTYIHTYIYTDMFIYK